MLLRNLFDRLAEFRGFGVFSLQDQLVVHRKQFSLIRQAVLSYLWHLLIGPEGGLQLSL